jgi:ABC-type uncharacterized transport system permease subunit
VNVGDASLLGVLTLTSMVTVALTAVGEVVAERSGVVNIGLEGILLVSAWVAVYASLNWGGWPAAYLAGMAAGAALGLIHALIAVYAGGDQIIAGVGVNIAAAGLTTLATRAVWGNYAQSPSVESIPPSITLMGQRVSFMVPLTFIVAVAAWWILERTSIGLKIRAVGDDPRAADALGISVERVRLASTVAGAALAGLAGAYMSADYLGSFSKLMSAGRGFIALAAVAFSGWDPLGALLGALVFGFGDALGRYYSITRGVTAEAYLYYTMPYILTLLAVSATAWRARMPRALGRPYRRE